VERRQDGQKKTPALFEKGLADFDFVFIFQEKNLAVRINDDYLSARYSEES
jgi:hypothetical protein